MINLDNLIHAIYASVLSAGDALAQKNMEILETYFENADEPDTSKLKPKTVTIQYPRVTSSGVEVHDVIVPLIALVPISMTKITKVKLKTNLEIYLNDNELSVGFLSKQTTDCSKHDDDSNEKSKVDTPTGSLEISISPAMAPDGLKKLIEGYEKALRAQIPG